MSECVLLGYRVPSPPPPSIFRITGLGMVPLVKSRCQITYRSKARKQRSSGRSLALLLRVSPSRSRCYCGTIMRGIGNGRKVRCHIAAWKTCLHVSRLGTTAHGKLKMLAGPSVRAFPFCPRISTPRISDFFLRPRLSAIRRFFFTSRFFSHHPRNESSV